MEAKRTIVILMDSLNRHYLAAYGDDRVKTPNLDRLANMGMIFDNHYAGSLPCMPARRELFTGRSNFLETPWSPLQPYDTCLQDLLRGKQDIYSHLITDHYHYWELNGLGYHTVFNTWEFLRGQEGDHLYPKVKDPEVPEYRGKNRRQDWVNRQFMDLERDEDYPTPQCFERGMEFLRNNHKETGWHLHLEVFDPHEPFLCPSEYSAIYSDSWDKDYHFDWPSYAPVDPECEGEEAVQHIRNLYAASLTRADRWLGKFLDVMDKYSMWEDTMVILTTDHGHLLGEHGYWAKNYMFVYNELVHIPLIIYDPEAERNGERIQALTSTIDIMPTLLDYHGVNVPGDIHGKSLLDLFDGEKEHHNAILYGYFGRDINMTDGRYTYCRQPLPDSVAYHHTAMPAKAFQQREKYQKAECGRFLSHTELPVYRVPERSRRHHGAPEFNLIYDLELDPGQKNPLRSRRLEKKLSSRLKELMSEYDAPASEYERVGLS